MTRAVIIAALALSGCQLALPTPADVCALPPAAQQTFLEAMGSTVEAMALACAVVK